MKTGFKIIGWLIIIVITLFILTLEIKEIANCEGHEFVITSRYDYWHKGYRTVSKCINCGLVID